MIKRALKKLAVLTFVSALLIPSSGNPQTPPVVFLLIDDESIDSGSETIEEISFNPPFCGKEKPEDDKGKPDICVNSDISEDAGSGLITPLFSRGVTDITPFSGLVLSTGQVGDEGLFSVGLSATDLDAFIADTLPNSQLDPIFGLPLGEEEINGLVGKIVCAKVKDSDVSDLSGGELNVQGAYRGLTAFEVTSVSPNPEGGSNLPLITVDLLPSSEVQTICEDKPTITATVEPPANTAGWNNSDVTVSFTCTDHLSGIESCTDPITVTTEGSGQVVSGTAVDLAGNTATVDVALNIDKTPPILSISVGAVVNDPTPQISGDFSDSGSGVDVSQLVIRLDGFDVTAQANVTASGFTFTPTIPLSEGSHTVSVIILDLATNLASASSIFTVDFTPPAITNLAPADGDIVTTATLQISADFSDNLSGINLSSVQILVDGVDQTAEANITASGFTLQVAAFSADSHSVSISVSDIAGNFASDSSTFTVSLGPQLDPIGDKIVDVGSSLSFTVSATNSGGGAVTFSVTPLPLPANATFNVVTGLFTFSPGDTQVGSIDLTFAATSDGKSDSETITITVPPLPGVTSLQGRVLTTNSAPLENVRLVVGTVETFSNANGEYFLNNILSGEQRLLIDASTVDPSLGTFATVPETVTLIPGAANVLEPPIFLLPLDVASGDPVAPTLFATVTSSPVVIDGETFEPVTLTVPAGTAFNEETGEPFTGIVHISRITDPALGPRPMPEDIEPSVYIALQPFGVKYVPRARISFPNVEGFAPGSIMDIFALDHDTGVFEKIGEGVVSDDGSVINSIGGIVKSNSWHATVPPPPITGESTDNNSTNQDKGKETSCPCGSEVSVQSGAFSENHTLASYRSLGVSRSVQLIYNSASANPRPILSIESRIGGRTPAPLTMSSTLTVGGIDQGFEVFAQPSAALIRPAAQFDGSSFSTGLYPFTFTVHCNFPISRRSRSLDGNVLVQNEISSPFGPGWTLVSLHRIHFNADGSLLLTTGDGSISVFAPNGPDTFDSPPGDFSTLTRNPNGTFTRRMKDGTLFSFDTEGRQTSLTDRNGNETTYTYDGSDRLQTITDPAELVTTFNYGPDDLISGVTDPAGRTTQFLHDTEGNLTQITDPDGSVRTFDYQPLSHLMVSQTRKRGFTTQYEYDFAGRFSNTVRADGSISDLLAKQTLGLVDPSGGQGTETNPAPPPPLVSQIQSALTDAKGNVTSFDTDTFGATTSQTDSLGNLTLIERDSNSNPTKITRPNGAVLTMSYDTQANLLTSTDPVGATTTFTYEPNFNQVTSITDPKGNPTTISYDANGNPIEITDTLNNKTQMTYDSRGLLTSVTSAVGEPEENTTTFTYDTNGNLLTTTDPLNNTTILEYDSAGNVSNSTDAEVRVTEFTYDSMNRLVSVLDPNNGVTSYSYDNKGNLTEVTDAKNQTTTFAYDEMDRLVSATNPLNLTETFSYDANGNLISTTNRNAQILNFDYDALNRLTKKTLPPTSTEIGPQDTVFNYDSVGNLIAVVNPTIGVFNQYDSANRLISSLSTTEEVLGGTVQLINTPITIDENNVQFEGRTLQVNGTTLTVSGPHTFANLILSNGAVLTHSPTTATEIRKLEIIVSGTLQIDSTSRIDVTGRGFLGAHRPGNPFGSHGVTVGFQ